MFLVIMGLLNFSSCEDYLEKYPLDKPSDATFYSTESELSLAVNGIYNHLYFQPMVNNPIQVILDCISDINWERDQGSDVQLLSRGLQNPLQNLYSNTWFDFYKAISKCNMLLANMNKAKQNTQIDVYNRIEGEARFFRAYYYHLLMSFFGDVPLLIKPVGINEKVTATPRNEILSFVLDELEAASLLLPDKYSGNDIGRITKGAALAIKARAALFNDEWSIAADACQRIISSNIYALEPNYNNLFGYAGENTKEEIISIQYSRTNNKVHGIPGSLLSRMGSGYSNKVPTQTLVDSYYCTDGLPINTSPLYDASHPFQNRDPRLNATIVVPGSRFAGYQFETHPDSIKCWDYTVIPPVRRANQDVLNPYATFSGYCWRKYTGEERVNRLNSEINVILVRYAEVLLMYAEAKNELAQMDQSAYDAFNLVRTRVNMPIVNGKSQSEMRYIIRQERKVELAMEGLRFFDIRRWGIAQYVMNGPLYGRPKREYLIEYVPTFDENGIPQYNNYADKLRVFDQRAFNADRDYLWPIPQKELDINTHLIQNPGY